MKGTDLYLTKTESGKLFHTGTLSKSIFDIWKSSDTLSYLFRVKQLDRKKSKKGNYYLYISKNYKVYIIFQHIFNRPCVARAVLLTSLYVDNVIHGLPPESL